jgi:hypothetical protein
MYLCSYHALKFQKRINGFSVPLMPCNVYNERWDNAETYFKGPSEPYCARAWEYKRKDNKLSDCSEKLWINNSMHCDSSCGIFYMLFVMYFPLWVRARISHAELHTRNVIYRVSMVVELITDSSRKYTSMYSYWYRIALFQIELFKTSEKTSWIKLMESKCIKTTALLLLLLRVHLKSIKVSITSVPNFMNTCQLVETLPKGTLSREHLHFYLYRRCTVVVQVIKLR